jgi:hypothetical protein
MVIARPADVPGHMGHGAHSPSHHTAPGAGAEPRAARWCAPLRQSIEDRSDATVPADSRGDETVWGGPERGDESGVASDGDPDGRVRGACAPRPRRKNRASDQPKNGQGGAL